MNTLPDELLKTFYKQSSLEGTLTQGLCFEDGMLLKTILELL